MSDLIDRQAAIDCIERSALTDDSVDTAIRLIEVLPSAQPEKETCKDCKWEDAFGYGECHHCKRRFEDMWEKKDNE